MWRFIAGAKCPQCKKLDTLQVKYQADQYLSRCVNCDYLAQLDMNTNLPNTEAAAKSSPLNKIPLISLEP